KYDGDINKYMNSGGLMAVNDYQQKILQSDEYKNAIQNKTNMMLWMKDRASGDKWMKGVEVEKEFDDGKGGKEKRMVNTTMEEQLKLFQDGKINNFKYNGSEKKINVNPALFKKSIKDATKPYSKDNIVTQSNVFDAVLMQGGSKEQAMERAQDYGNAIKATGDPNTAWKWGAGDPTNLMKLDQQASQHKDMMRYRYWSANQNKQMQMYKAKYGDKKGDNLMAITNTTYRQLLNSGDQGTNPNFNVANEIPKMLPNFFTPYKQGDNNPYGANFVYSGPMFNASTDVNGMTSITGSQLDAENVQLKIGDPGNSQTAFINLKDANGQNQVYMPVFAVGDNKIFGQAEANGAANNWKVNENYTSLNGSTTGNSMVGLIPVGDWMKTQSVAQGMDKSLGLTHSNEQSELIGTASTEGLQQQFAQDMSNMGVDINDPAAVQNFQNTYVNQIGSMWGSSMPGGITVEAMTEYEQNMNRNPQ
ncbi:MAG: hypothetical protein V3W20_08510, partial [Candidatus Neomarinimicrobiota bacterium]